MKMRTETKRIILHHSLSGDVSARIIDRWHRQRGWAQIGYHYVVRTNGDVENGRDVNRRGAHAVGRNKDSIGVCITGDFRYDDPTQEQLVSLLKLIAVLKITYGELAVEYHRDGDNACPAVKFPRDLLDYIIEHTR